MIDTDTRQQACLLDQVEFEPRSKPPTENLVVVAFRLGTAFGEKIVRMQIGKLAPFAQQCQQADIPERLEVRYARPGKGQAARAHLLPDDLPHRQKTGDGMPRPALSVGRGASLDDFDRRTESIQCRGDKSLPFFRRFRGRHLLGVVKRLNKMKRYLEFVSNQSRQKAGRRLFFISWRKIDSHVTNPRLPEPIKDVVIHLGIVGSSNTHTDKGVADLVSGDRAMASTQ